MRPLLMALVGVGLLHSAAVHAQAPDAARLAAAKQLLEASGSVATMVAAMKANLPAQRRVSPQVPEEFWIRFEARIVKDAPQLVDSIAVLYARTFSLADLQAITVFYRSPVGQRMRDLQPTIATESSGIGQRWGMKIGAEVGASLEKP